MIEEYRSAGSFNKNFKNYTLPLLVEKNRIGSLYKKSSDEYQDAERQIGSLKMEIRKEQNQLLAGMKIDLNAMIKMGRNT